MDKFIKALPKVELHLHIEGSLEPELMFKIANRNKIKLRFKSIKDVRKAYQFSDLQSFLDIYYEGANVLLKEKDFFDLTWEYLKKMSKENVRHVEIFFDPQTHTDRGVSFKTVVTGIHKALVKARSDFGISHRLILCFLRHLDEKSAIKTLKQSLPYKKWITAVGLDSSEVGHPPSKFKRVFAMAQKNGFLSVAHAGEEGPPAYIWQALKLLKVDRIDHGVRCLEDKKLVTYLKNKKVPLTVCPYSNVKLKVFKKIKDHNLKQLLNNKLVATINSDDPAYFGGYLTENYIGTAKALKLSKHEIETLVINSVNASFLNKIEKQKLILEINKVAKKFGK